MYKLIIALLALCVLASCSQPTVTLRARVLERNTIMLVKGEIPTGQKSMYLIGDTIWVNMHTSKVDNADSTAMLAVVEQFY